MKMLKYKIGLIIAVIMGSLSCSKDIIELSPTGTVLESNFYKTEQELFQGLVAAYDPLGFATNLTMGILGRAVPQLNVMTTSFQVTIMVTIAFFIISLPLFVSEMDFIMNKMAENFFKVMKVI